MFRSTLLVLGAVLAAASVGSLIGADEPVITAKHERAARAAKTDLRPCDGLWIRHESARFRGAKQCAPGADLTKQRPLPRHILTSPL